MVVWLVAGNLGFIGLGWICMGFGVCSLSVAVFTFDCCGGVCGGFVLVVLYFRLVVELLVLGWWLLLVCF